MLLASTKITHNYTNLKIYIGKNYTNLKITIVRQCQSRENTYDSGSPRSGSHDNALTGSGSDMGLEFFCITTDTKCRPPLTDMSLQRKSVTSPTRSPQ